MRHKKFKFCAVLFLGLGLTGLQAQTMYVKERNGTQTACTLRNVQKITFSTGNVTIQKPDNSTGVYALSGLKHLSFKDYTSEIKEKMQSSSANLITYPNPVTNMLNIDLSGSENRSGTISILSIDGKVLQEQKTNDTGIVSLNLSKLPQGIYLCRYSNATEIKTVKIIKH